MARCKRCRRIGNVGRQEPSVWPHIGGSTIAHRMSAWPRMIVRSYACDHWRSSSGLANRDHMQSQLCDSRQHRRSAARSGGGPEPRPRPSVQPMVLIKPHSWRPVPAMVSWSVFTCTMGWGMDERVKLGQGEKRRPAAVDMDPNAPPFCRSGIPGKHSSRTVNS